MAYTISADCTACGICQVQCPTGAIKLQGHQYQIEPNLCNNCKDSCSEPQCVVFCPYSYPVPLQAKKGRCKVDARRVTSPDLFLNGINHPVATAMVIWEACNLLAQRQSLPWTKDALGKFSYQRKVNQGRGAIAFRIAKNLDRDIPIALSGAAAVSALEAIDIRSACTHLLYAAHATALDKPWEQEFTLDDRQIEKYLGLDKRKDLSKVTKLTLIKELAQQPCLIKTSIKWPQQGHIKGFSVEESPLWHLLEIKHHFQEDAAGCQHLIGLTFRIRAGIWAKYFLNKQGCKERTAFYQYGTLPKSILSFVMSLWQQHEGAARIMLWLLFKVKLGKEQRITVPTLMRVAYGEEKITRASSHREERKRLLRTFESDLEVLSHYNLKPVFDPLTYMPEIQPLWAKLSDIPEDAEEALDFWINDGSQTTRLTDAAPRGKWDLLMNARILYFELPQDWDRSIPEFANKKQQSPTITKSKSRMQATLSGNQIMIARKNRGISQRDLAQMTGKSQSWIRDIENGRFQAKLEDQDILRKVLDLA